MLAKCVVILTLLLFGTLADPDCSSEFRSVTGACNSRTNPTYGSAPSTFEALPGEFDPRTDRKFDHVRRVSNILFALPTDFRKESKMNAAERKWGPFPDQYRRNAFFVTWGQFVTHDYMATALDFGSRQISIDLDKWDPLAEGAEGVKLGNAAGLRSADGKRIVNRATPWLDLSLVYGTSNEVLANVTDSSRPWRLKTSEDGFELPTRQQISGNNFCGPTGSGAPDARSDDAVQLTVIHTLWLRIHNNHADRLWKIYKNKWTPYECFQRARELTIAEYQHITMYEWLPTLLGPVYRRMPSYRGYKDGIDPTLSTSFAGIAFRTMHDMVATPALILDRSCRMIKPLGDMVDTSSRRPFFQENLGCQFTWMKEKAKTENVLRGALEQSAAAPDGWFSNTLRQIFKTEGGSPNDIESVILYRGIDMQTMDYNTYREKYTGRSVFKSDGCRNGGEMACFLAMTRDRAKAERMKEAYGNVKHMDPYSGMSHEDLIYPTHHFFPTASEIIMRTFNKIRKADRFWYENIYHPRSSTLRTIKSMTVSDLIRRVFPGVRVNDYGFRMQHDCPMRRPRLYDRPNRDGYYEFEYDD